jgi:hypothetical protein
MELAELLCSKLSSSIGAGIADGFKIIVGDSEESLNKENKAIIKVYLRFTS